jgi:hypothetical protein
MTLSPLLDVTDVRIRYGLRDPRAARRVIRDAGGIEIAGRLFISAEQLTRYEHARALSPIRAIRAETRRAPGPGDDVASLPRRWWETEARGACVAPNDGSMIRQDVDTKERHGTRAARLA